MPRLRLAVPTAAFQQPVRRAIQSAARIGVDGVQFDLRNEIVAEQFGETARQQLRHYLSEFGLAVASTTLPTQGSLVDADRLDARVAAIQRSLEFARQLGAGVLTVRLGPVPSDESDPAYQRLVDVLNDLARHGNRVGGMVAVSTLGNSTEALRTLFTRVHDGPLGLDIDPAGCVFRGDSPAGSLRALHDLATHIQIRDGYRTAEGAGIEAAIGAGATPWDEFLATVLEIDYRGWLTVRRTGGDDIPGDLSRGVQYVRTVTAGAF